MAASYARVKLDVKKVLIVDWDVHHGNGTQSIFLEDPNVLYFSVHRYERNFFPFSSNGGPSVVGSKEGVGFNVNVAWTSKYMGDDEYQAVWDHILMPIAKLFQPDLVLVSAGFDCARGDVGECLVTPEGFSQLTRKLMTLAKGKVVCALEGGYVVSVLSRCVEAVLSAMVDKEGFLAYKNQTQVSHRLDDSLKYIDQSAAQSIRSTIFHQNKFWKLW